MLLCRLSLADTEAHAAGEVSALQHARLLADVGDAPFIVLSDDNGTVAQRTQNAGRIRPEHSLTQEQWDTFVVGVHRIAQSVRDETGLRTVFHHHCARICRNTCGGGHVNAADQSEFGGVVF